MNGIPIISTKERQVWMAEQTKKLDAITIDLRSAGVGVLLTCLNPHCPDPRLQLVRDDTDPLGRMLECGCTRRMFERKVRKH